MAKGVTIDFTANLARFTGAIDKATSDLNKFQTNAQRMAGNMKGIFGSLGVGLSVVGLGALVVKSFKSAEALVDMSRALGIGTENLQSFQYAADLVGVSQETLQTGLQKLSVKIGDAASGTSAAVKSFNDIGVAILDSAGKSRDVGDVYKELAQKIDSTGDANKKAALAVEFFGKSGKDMVNALSPEFIRLADDAAKVGAVIGDDLLQNAAKTKDQFDAMSRVISAQLTSAFVSLAPLLTSAADGFSKLAKAVGDAYSDMQSNRAAGISKEIDSLAKHIEALKVIVARKESAPGFLKGLFGDPEQEIKDTEAKIRALTARLELLRRDAVITPKTVSAGNQFAFAKDGAKDDSAAREQERQIKAAASFIQSLREQAELLGLSAVEADKYKAGLLGIRGAQLKLVEGYSQQKVDQADQEQFIKDQIQADEDAIKAKDALIQKMKEEGDAITQSVIPLEAYRVAMARLIELFEHGDISLEAFTLRQEELDNVLKDSTKKTTDEVTEFWKAAAQNMESAMSGFFFDIMQGNLSDLAGSFKRTIDRMVSDLLASQLLNFLKSGGAGDFIGSLLSSAKGNVFGPSGHVTAFAGGGVVSNPTLFKFAGGTGLMGEAGPEAIMPLKRDSRGRLGVSGGGGVTVINQFTISGPTNRQSQTQIAQAAGMGVQRAMARNG